MKLSNANADISVPDGSSEDSAFKRTTHLGVGAHQDDLEFMATHGILECFGKQDKWFTGVTCTDGAGSPRTGIYADCTDDNMKVIRQGEQKVAARIGRYSAVVQLMYSSKAIKDPKNSDPANDLVEIMKAAKPEAVYTHNPADKHATHVAVALNVIKAVRRLPKEERPKKIYGTELWRSLDWMPDKKKVVLDVGGRDHLVASLAGVHDSQIAGGKRYDLALMGRIKSNATYLDSHAVDVLENALYSMDLTPLAQDDTLDVTDYVLGLVDEFKSAVKDQIAALQG